jgi:hypothetical protein
MPHPFPKRQALRAALLLASGLSASCGDPKRPSIPDPPQVTLTVPEGNVVDKVLKVVVTVSGCEKVSKLSLNDRDTPLKTFPYTEGTVTLELTPADIPFPTVGMAANLSLNAEAVCDDDRKNRSQPQAATWFPVAQVKTDPQNGAPFNYPLAIEGSGSNAAFISCGQPTNGVPTLYRLSANGEVRAQQMPTTCTPETVITAPSPQGNRWVWTPGVTAFSLDSGFNITARSNPNVLVSALTVMDNGDAVVMDRNILRRLSQSDSDSLGVAREVWNYEPPQIGPLIAPPWVRSGSPSVLMHATLITTSNASRADLIINEVDPATGAFITRRTLRNILGTGNTFPVPAGAFSDDGNTLYLAFPVGTDQGQVVACVTTGDGCTGSTARWTSPVLGAEIERLVPYAGGSRVAAVGAQRTWLLDDTNQGSIRNKDNASVDANGALTVLHVLPGRVGTNDLFLLAGPARRQGDAPTLPMEIIALDQAPSGQARELYRYQVPVSMGAALDFDGRVWLRTGGKLAQALPTSQYRAFRPNP